MEIISYSTPSSVMSPNENYGFRSYIKDIFIEVPNYYYNHKPHSGVKTDSEKKGERNHHFIGRSKLQASFLDILRKGDRNGAYLVTGYRGMGKTSLVNHVVHQYKDEHPRENITPIKISLAQAKLDEIHVLKHILKVILDHVAWDRKRWLFPVLEYSAMLFALIALGVGLHIQSSEKFKLFGDNSDDLTLSGLGFFLVFVALLFIVALNAAKFLISAWGLLTVDRKTLGRFPHYLLIPTLAISLIIAVAAPHWESLGTTVDMLKSCLPFKPNSFSGAGIIIMVALTTIYYVWNFRRLHRLYGLYKRINVLYERSHANVTTEGEGTSLLKDISFSFTGRSSRAYPLAQAKEIEYELIEILKTYTDRKFIFIFDELDKVEMEGEFDDDEKSGKAERTFLNDLRERKQIIIRVLSSLKHLLTEATARFIFIAGREMFDASLADISDRQSALGSIFHHTLYVESFLKETKLVNHAENTSSNSLVEEYLDHILLGNLHRPKKRWYERIWQKVSDYCLQSSDERKRSNANKEFRFLQEKFCKYEGHPIENQPFLYRYWELLKDIRSTGLQGKREAKVTEQQTDYEASLKIMFTLQNFVTYLSYRCNGSPKKLIKLIEENFVKGESAFGTKSDFRKQWGDGGRDIGMFSNDMQVVVCSTDTPLEEKVFFNFSYRQQYKLGFNAYLFFPFLSLQKNLLENYSDSVNVSTPYLMDSIIKFHPFAFSNHNLELLPEFLSTNKAPEIRYFVQELIDFLGKNHIRETDTGLFKYKFFDRTHNEIAYISRISDEESAAFNFSLDESSAIKSHIINKIEYLREVFKDFKKANNSSVESILFLNDLLGDSQLFDEYYKDAIISLSDALHDVTMPNRHTPIESFLIWMRIKLKLSMVFDKMRYYEMAVGHLGLAMEVSLDYLAQRYSRDSSEIDIKAGASEANVQVQIHTVNVEGNSPQKMTTPLYRELLQVTQHAILGSMYVQEKFAEGLTYAKMNSYLDQYAKIHEHSAFRGYLGRDMMMASFYLGLGTVLYFKNKTLPLNKTQMISAAYDDIRSKIRVLDVATGKESDENESRWLEQRFLDKVEDIIGETPVFRIGSGDAAVSPELSFHQYIKPSYAELYTCFRTFEKVNTERGDFRFSFITYIAYKKSLATYLAVDWKFDTNTGRKNLEDTRESLLTGPFSLQSIIGKAVSIFKDYKNVHGSKKLISLANVITKLADHLLALYVPLQPVAEEESGKNNYKLHEIVYAQQLELYKTAKKNNTIPVITSEEFIDDWIFGDKNIDSFASKWEVGPVKLTYLLNLYYLAGRLYARAGRNVSYCFQLRKILMAIRTTGSLSAYPAEELKLLVEFLENTILHKILQLNSMANGSSDRSQIAAMKYFTKIPNISLPPDQTRVFYQNLASNPDSKEALIIFSEIRLFSVVKELGHVDFETAVKKIDSLSLIGPFNSMSHQAVRIMELGLQVKINKVLLEKVINPGLSRKVTDQEGRILELTLVGKGNSWAGAVHKLAYALDFNDVTRLTVHHSQAELYSDSEKAVFKYLINHIANAGADATQPLANDDCRPYRDNCAEHGEFADVFESYADLIANSIFCLHQCVLTSNMYGVNYMQGPAYIAGFYRKMGDWIKHLNLCRIVGKYLSAVGKQGVGLNKCQQRILDATDKLENTLERLVGRTALRSIDDSLSHYQNAIEQYNSSIQLHSEGPAYKHQLNNMIYLEDDYGDNLNHFGAAIERQMINSGKTRKLIQWLEGEMSISRLFNYANYYAQSENQA